MTPQLFFRKLRAYRGHFALSRRSGTIRHRRTNCCPIVQLANDFMLDHERPPMYREAWWWGRLTSAHWTSAARVLRIPLRSALALVAAADKSGVATRVRLRHRRTMLKTLGLTEQEDA